MRIEHASLPFHEFRPSPRVRMRELPRDGANDGLDATRSALWHLKCAYDAQLPCLREAVAHNTTIQERSC